MSEPARRSAGGQSGCRQAHVELDPTIVAAVREHVWPLIASGRVTRDHDQPVIFNPRYELRPVGAA